MAVTLIVRKPVPAQSACLYTAAVRRDVDLRDEGSSSFSVLIISSDGHMGCLQDQELSGLDRGRSKNPKTSLRPHSLDRGIVEYTKDQSF